MLAQKQKKIGADFLNGFGGRAEVGDRTIADTNIRETEEESGIRVTNAKKVGEVAFHNPSEGDELNRTIVHIYIATEWEGEPADTDEMKGAAWYEIANLDYGKFLSGDRLFIPQVLGGICVKGLIEYNDDWSVKAHSIDEVDGF